MIFDDISEVMNMKTARTIERETGLNREKVRRIANGLPFVLDYNTVYALKRLGFEIEIKKIGTRN